MFWITLGRAIVAVIFGIGLIFARDLARPQLVHFMGFYWLLLGVMEFRAISQGVRPGRLLTVAGIVAGVTTGLAVIFHSIVLGGESSIFTRFVGTIIMLTGVIHILGGFRLEETPLPRWRPGQAVGVVEIILGSILMLALVAEPVYWLAVLWALLVGAFFLLDAKRLRAAAG